MAESDRADLERIAAEVVAAVEELLRSGKRGRVEINVKPDKPKRPVGDPVVFLHDGKETG